MSFNGFSSIRKIVSSSKFLYIVRHDISNIKRAKFIPPTLGKKGDFGKFIIEYNHAPKSA